MCVAEAGGSVGAKTEAEERRIVGADVVSVLAGCQWPSEMWSSERRGAVDSIPSEHKCWQLSSTSNLQQNQKHHQGYSHLSSGFNSLLGKCSALHTHPLSDREQRSVRQTPQWHKQHLQNQDLKSAGVLLSTLMASVLPSVRHSC